MRTALGMLVAGAIVVAASPLLAQDVRRTPPYPSQEECPQGRQIRAQKPYPASMTDCQVLDADTAAANERLRGGRQQPAQPARASTNQTLPAAGTAPPAAAADDLYRPRPNEVYSPPTYCNWNRTGLPPAYQKICADRDQKVGVYKPDWKSIEADNGAVYKVDLNSVSRYTNGTLDILIYAVEGSDFDPRNLSRLWFDCRGHFRDQTNGIGPTQYAAPRSIAGRISQLACAGAKDTSSN
jgi:hypothetical protein